MPGDRLVIALEVERKILEVHLQELSPAFRITLLDGGDLVADPPTVLLRELAYVEDGKLVTPSRVKRPGLHTLVLCGEVARLE